MPSIKDSNGKEWTFSVVTSAIERVRNGTGIDLLKSMAADTLPQLVDDAVKLHRVLYFLCQRQAESEHVSIEEFVDLWRGDSSEEALFAVLQGVADFFPTSRRKVMIEGVDLLRRQISEAAAEAEKKLTSLGLSTNSPDSSESTQEN